MVQPIVEPQAATATRTETPTATPMPGGGPLAPRAPGPARPAVFLDRDGVLNVDSGWISRPEDLTPLPGALAAVARLSASDYARCVVTNQSVVARGWCDEERLAAIHDKLLGLLAQAGASLDGLYYCPHHPGPEALPHFRTECACRKPAPGMLLRAASDLGLDIGQSWIVGDSSTDMGLAHWPQTRGLGAVLVRTGHGGRDGKTQARPHFVVDDVAAAVRLILESWPRLEELLREPAAAIKPGDVVLIAGAARQGKSTLAHALCLHLERQGRDTLLLSLDDWVLPVDRRTPGVMGRYEMAAAEDAVRQLVARQPLTPPHYDAPTRTRHPGRQTLTPKADTVLIIEGVPALASAAIRALGDHRWFIDGDEDARRTRFFQEYARRGWETAEIAATYEQRLRDEHPVVQASADHADRHIHMDGLLP